LIALPFRNRRLLGLDVGAASIKAVEVVRRGQDLHLTGYGVIGRSGTNETADIVALLDAFNLRARRTVSAVGGRAVIARLIKLDDVGDDQLAERIKVEADRYIPFELDEVILDCQRLVAAGHAELPLDTLLVAARRSFLDKHVAALRAAGLDPLIVEVDAFSLSNAYELRERRGLADPGQVTGLLDIGSTRTNLVIRLGSTLVFTREIYFGGADLDEAIARALDVPEAEAERIKQAPLDQQQRVLTAVAAAMGDLTGEVRLSLEYVAAQHGRAVDQLLISGGGAMLEGIDELLDEQIGQPVARWDPTEVLSIASSVNRQTLARDAAQLAVAVGLACRALDLP
jgi:type IV pilus assembly protein PilM